jgi:hypothetical protein
METRNFICRPTGDEQEAGIGATKMRPLHKPDLVKYRGSSPISLKILLPQPVAQAQRLLVGRCRIPAKLARPV